MDYKQNKRFLFPFLVFLAAFSMFCGGQIKLQEGEQRLISKSKNVAWPFQINENYEVGISQPCATEVDARSKAILDARKKIIDRIGVQLTVEQREKIINSSDVVDNSIVNTAVEGDIRTKAISQGIISVKAQEYYIEKYAQMNFGQIEYFYIAYVLTPFSEAEHNALIRTTFETMKSYFQTQYSKIELLPNDQIQTKLAQLGGLNKICSSTRDLVGMKPELLADITKWENEIEQLKTTYLNEIVVVPLGKDQPIGQDRKLTEPIGVRITCHDQPLNNVKVTLSRDGEILIQGNTDFQGEFLHRCSFPVIGMETITVLSCIDETMPLNSVQFNFDNPIQIIVKIPEFGEHIGYQQRNVETAVVKRLVEKNVSVNQGCSLSDEEMLSILDYSDFSFIPDSSCIGENLLLLGRALASDTKRMPLADNLMVSEAFVEILFVDPVTRTVIWKFRLEEKEGLATTFSAAENDALKKLSVKAADQVGVYLMKQQGIAAK